MLSKKPVHILKSVVIISNILSVNTYITKKLVIVDISQKKNIYIYILSPTMY